MRKKHNIQILFDQTRCVENDYSIKKREEGYYHGPIKDIVHEMTSHGDGCTMSEKQDYLVNMGGFLATKDDDLFARSKELVVVFGCIPPYDRLTAHLYIESGVCAMERGIISAGRNKDTGEHHRPKLELVRIKILRRVYTYAHMDTVADAVITLYNKRASITGLEFVYEHPILSYFNARFKPL